MRIKSIIAATVATLSLMSTAQALEVTIDNQTDANVAMTFSYLDNKEKDWVVDGWYNVDAKQDAIINLDTVNDMYYLYAEFSNGKKLEGGQGAVTLNVQKKSFFYKQKEAPTDTGMEVSFLKARGNNGKAIIRIK